MKIHKLIGLIAVTIIGTTLASEPFSSAEYMTNRVNTSLSPYDISVCRSVQWFRNNETNQFNPTNALSGDKILVLVDVPMSVVVPASIETKETGMRNFEGASEYFAQVAMITEINRMTTGVLLIKAENAPVVTRIVSKNRYTLPFVNLINEFVT